MRKSAAKPKPKNSSPFESSGSPVRQPCPQKSVASDTSKRPRSTSVHQLRPSRKRPVRTAYLDGNFARRSHEIRPTEYSIYDTELTGFGLRVRPSGRCFWFVRLRRRGKHRRISLGCTQKVSAEEARAAARRHLEVAALDGLPKRVARSAAPLFADYAAEFWRDQARHWKPATQARNAQALKNDLLPAFGGLPVDAIQRSDIIRWRDDCATVRETLFNRSVPVLSAMFRYAEQLGYCPKGTNPCRGMKRFKRTPLERYLTPAEYARLGRCLREDEDRYPRQVAILRLLLFTGARRSEIIDLQWAWVQPPRLMLPDSKTGPKIILLNTQACAVLAGVKRHEDCPYVFPNVKLTRPMYIDPWWLAFRRRCALPDVRLHDLRHSFASVGINENIPLATIGKLLGHVLPETTARYAHLADDSIADAAKRVSGGLAQAIGLTA